MEPAFSIILAGAAVVLATFSTRMALRFQKRCVELREKVSRLSCDAEAADSSITQLRARIVTMNRKVHNQAVEIKRLEARRSADRVIIEQIQQLTEVD